MSNNREPEQQEQALLEYGAYIVLPLKEAFADEYSTLHNYGVYRVGTSICEATTASLPQAMQIAMALQRALEEIYGKLDEEQQEEVAEATIQ